nr:MAG TPA: hypothetical protein [Caudoviricetes sp.]
MRLIDADALKKAIPETTVDASTKYRYCVTFEREDVLAIIDAAPTVDIDRPTRSQFKRMAVQLGYEPVVHCKDCRRGEPDLYLNGGEDEVWCNYYDCPKPAAGFCEKGKRKNDFVDDNKIGERRTDANEPDGT